MTPRNMHICDRLRTARDELGLTQAEMAARMGISLRAYQTYEANERQPRANDVAALADAGIDLNWLLTGLGRMWTGPRPQPGGVRGGRLGGPLGGPLGGMSEPEPPPPPVPVSTDHRLIGRLTEGIARVFREEGQTAALHQIAERAAIYHDRIVAMATDPDDRLLAAGEILAELRLELRQAAENPAESKRLA